MKSNKIQILVNMLSKLEDGIDINDTICSTMLCNCFDQCAECPFHGTESLTEFIKELEILDGGG